MAPGKKPTYAHCFVKKSIMPGWVPVSTKYLKPDLDVAIWGASNPHDLLEVTKHEASF